jgi:orotate phosphoribosyltransferase
VEAHAGAVADTITGLLVRRRGHFQMESGYHSAAWFELRSLFDHPDDLSPFVTELARRLASHGVDSVCGPMTGGAKLARLIARELRIECFEAERIETPGKAGLFPVKYELPESQRQRARARSVAIVDDAISAGSAVRGTYADLVAHSARPVALGALIVFGDAAEQFAADRGLALEAIQRMPLEMWGPAECPLCEAGVAIDPVSAG